MSHAATEFGKWLARERGERRWRGKPLSTIKFAQFLNAYIKSQKLPLKPISQQQISFLETASIEKGPKRPQPWWGVVRDFIESGALDELLSLPAPPDEPAGGAVILDIRIEAVRRLAGQQHETEVRSRDGKVIGKIVWQGDP